MTFPPNFFNIIVVSLQNKKKIVLHKCILGGVIYFAQKRGQIFEIERRLIAFYSQIRSTYLVNDCLWIL